MDLRRAYLRAAAETREQALALLDTRADLIYIDCGYIPPEDWAPFVKAAHEAGKAAGLRLPHIFRKQAADWLEEHSGAFFGAGFDAWLLRSLEELSWISEKWLEGALQETALPALVFDYTMYGWNRQARALLNAVFELCLKKAPEPSMGPEAQKCFRGAEGTGSPELWETLPLELNCRELKALLQGEGTGPRARSGESEPYALADGCRQNELVVYGRIPMMVSAQCIRRTIKGCDRHMCLMKLEDRTGAFLPVKNNCTFCYNTILNARPLVLYDLEKELAGLGVQSLRYEFTTENAREVKEIMAGKRIFHENEFTRGHFRRGVE